MSDSIVEQPTTTTEEPKPAGKEKLETIMEAADALTSLGDGEGEEETSDLKSVDTHTDEHVKVKSESEETTKSEDAGKTEVEFTKPPAKRHLPEHKKPDAALTFPEKLMNMMSFAEEEKEDREYCIAWCHSGDSFVIRNPDEFTKQVLPKFFKATKFSSFTRKLYRWGFRQLNRGIGPHEPIIFGNEFFHRDHAGLMAKMRSVTAASVRKNKMGNDVIPAPNTLADIEQQYVASAGNKRALDSLMGIDEQRKRMMLMQALDGGNNMVGQMGQVGADCMLAASANPMIQNQQQVISNMNLANALRGGQGFTSIPGMMQKSMNLMGNHSGFNPNAMSFGQPIQSMAQLYMPTANTIPARPNMNQYGSTQTPNTADILNAAINALRY